MLSKKGVGLTACGTCITYYGLNKLIDPVQVGDMVGVISELTAVLIMANPQAWRAR